MQARKQRLGYYTNLAESLLVNGHAFMQSAYIVNRITEFQEGQWR